MTFHLILIAHAPTAATLSAAFPTDEKLDERGRMKAAALAQQIRYGGKTVAAPERRTQETMTALGLTGETVAALRDCGYGLWARQSLDAVHRRDPDVLATWLSDPLFCPPGGESIADVFRRVSAWLDVQAKEGGRLTAVTHPTVLRAALIHALQAPLGSFWRIDITPFSELRLAHDGRQWKVQSLANLDR